MPARPQNNEPVAAGEQLMQLDQAITLTLQEIDENFSHAHQIVTSRILPAIREYETSCSKTWQGAQFWKHFFEASAQVSLSQQPLADVDGSFPEETTTDERRQDASATHSEMQSPPRLSHSVYAGESPAETSRTRAFESPFERLKHDVEQSHIDATGTSLDIPLASSPMRRERRPSARPRLSVVQNGASPSEKPLMLWDGIADLRNTPLRAGPPQPGDDSPAWPQGVLPPGATQGSAPRTLHADDVLSTNKPNRRRQSVVGTPLVRKGRRDSLPTPPTITKVQAAPTTAKTSASRLMDEDEGLSIDSDEQPPQLTKGIHESDRVGMRKSPRVSDVPGAFERMLASDDESDEDSDEDVDDVPLPPGHTGPLRAPDASQSHSSHRSIEDDTLFGVRT